MNLIAYSKEELDNKEIMKQTLIWFNNKFIQKSTFDTITHNHPTTLYSPNFFIRIGLFIFTCLSASAGNSLILLVTGFFDSSMSSFSIRFIIHGLLMYGLLEILIKEKKLYRAGIDDALLYLAIGTILTGLFNLFYTYEMTGENSLLLFCFLALPIFTFCAIRFIDMLFASLSFISLFSIVFVLIGKTGASSKFTLPFIIMISAGCLYFVAQKISKNESFRFWKNNLDVIEILSLILVYLAGNYFVIRTLSEELFHLRLQEGEDIPLAFLFYTYTVAVPILYIYYGLKNKVKIPIYVGLLAIALAVFTFKYYYSLGHHEISLTVGGILLILTAWLSIRYLKTPKHGITFAEDKDDNPSGILDAEALIIAQTFPNTTTQSEIGVSMGEGKFGGGGSDGNF